MFRFVLVSSHPEKESTGKFMSDEVKGRGQIGELIAKVFGFYEENELTDKEDFQEHDPFIQT